jgi:hypothetical protein
VIWADKAAAAWTLLVVLTLWALTVMSGPAPFGELVPAFLYAVVPLWLFMRGLDLIFSGGLRWLPTPPRGKSP